MRYSTITPTLNLSNTIGLLLTIIAVMLSGAARAETNPYLMPNDAWITISGTVDTVSSDSFVLDYGNGAVIVEFDDGDRDADAYKFIDGDQVTVSGKIDDDLFETTKIEASSVFVESINTTFFASAIDEESAHTLVTAVSIPVVPSAIILQGTVAKVGDDRFHVDTGEEQLIVSVKDMIFNPLDDQGFLKIKKGDRVKVHADMDKDFFSKQVLHADAIVKVGKGNS